MNADAFDKKIGYPFQNSQLREVALTRFGYAKEKRDIGVIIPNQDELRTLGDAVLKVALIQMLKDKGYKTSGEITKIKSTMEDKSHLSQMGINLNIWNDIWKDSGEEGRGPHAQPTLMEETVEAIIGAIFLDSNFETTKNGIKKWFEEHYDNEPKI